MGKVGYRFLPTEQELLEYFLYNKITENPILDEDEDDPVKVCDLYGGEEPWDLWNFYGGKDLLKEESLYFFTRLKKLSPNGSRFNRKIASGAWQGEDGAKPVISGGGSDQMLGFKKRFRYENGNNYEQNGRWIMYEYTINPLLLGGECSQKALDYVLCSMKKNESGRQKEKSVLGKKQTESKQICEKNGLEPRALERKRKLKEVAKPNNKNDYDDDKCVQNKRLKAEQEALLIQPMELPCANNVLQVVESEDFETERNSEPFAVEELFYDTHPREEVDYIECYIPEGDEFDQNKHLMSEQELLQVIEYEADTEPLFGFEEIFSNIDHEFDMVFRSTELELPKQWP